MILLVLPLAVPVILYVLLSLPAVQRGIASQAEKELTSLLGTEVEIGEVSVAPFNRIVLKDVVVRDSLGVEALTVGHLGAGLSTGESLWKERPVISYVELIDLSLRLYRTTAEAPLNIQPILDRFKPKEKKEPSKFDLAVNLLVIRRSSLTFDVLDAAPADSGRFDRNHIAVSGLRADIRAPRISDSDIDVEIKRMEAAEHCGLLLKELTASVMIGPEELAVNNFSIELDNSRLALNDMTFLSPLRKDFSLDGLLRSPVETLPESYLVLSDLSPFVNGFENINEHVDIDFELSGSVDSLVIRRFALEIPERDARISAHGLVGNLTRGKDSVSADLRRLNVVANVNRALGFMASPSSLLHSYYKKLQPLASLGDIDLLGDLSLTPQSLDFNGSLDTDCGNLDIDCGVMKDRSSQLHIDGSVASASFNPSSILPQLAPLTNVTFESEADLALGRGGAINGSVSLLVPEIILERL